MKSLSAPRRLYTRNGVTHICLSGKYFAPELGSESKLSLEHTVTCEAMPSDGGRARIEVTQARRGVKTVTEIWRSCNVPTNPRG